MFFFNYSVTPLVLVPGMFIFASQSWLTQVLVHGMVLPLLIFCKYQTCLRSYRPQTKFFAMWSLATFAFLFYIYQFHVVGILYWPRTVSPIENLILIGKYLYIKVEKILKGSLDSIPSPSVKIQIIGGKVCLRCKGKTFLGIVNKL